MIILTQREARQIEKILIERLLETAPDSYHLKLSIRLKDLLKFIRLAKDQK